MYWGYCTQTDLLYWLGVIWSFHNCQKLQAQIRPASTSFGGPLSEGTARGPCRPWLKIPCGWYSYGYPAVGGQIQFIKLVQILWQSNHWSLSSTWTGILYQPKNVWSTETSLATRKNCYTRHQNGAFCTEFIPYDFCIGSFPFAYNRVIL